PAVSVAGPASPVTEGNSGTSSATFTVSLSAASPQTVTVAYATADGTATAGSDYTATSGTLTFTPGQTTKTVAVPVKGDTADEADETFTVTLSNPTEATLGTTSATATIANDDGPAISISGPVSPVNEGNSGTTSAIFTVTLSAVNANDVTVNYATSAGSATAGSDFT